MDDLTGRSIKGYQLQERIGAGGFGAVYRAYQSTVGREVAIKIILPGFTSNPEFVRRFETEARLVARLEHMNIAPLYDYWRDPEGAFLVMRFLRGGSLRDALKRGPYDLESASVLLDQVAAALTLAHSHNVIHRDVKPENILLDEDGNAYIADFGIAKDLGIIKGDRTVPGSILGSPDYISPEQARNEPVTTRTDVYSLGIVLYEMIAGGHPYPGLSPVERLFKHISDPVPEITSLDPQISTAVNVVIQKATAKNPSQRFSDVRSLAAEFHQAAGLGTSRVARSAVELLTPREQEVLKLIVQGKSNREIARLLTIEIATVKWYANQIFRKLNVRSRVQAIVRARELDLIVATKQLGEALATSLEELPEPENPYKGLRAFQPTDEHHYYGREKLVQHLLSRLAEDGVHSRFLAVVGPSGSGKSSLVKAGLIPAVWRGGLPGSESWFIVEMVPSARPLEELEIALLRIAGPQAGDLREQLQRDERGLLRAGRLILPDDGSELMLVIDQFEEIFTLVEGEHQRAQFLNLLEAAVTDPRSRVRIVITLRADFYDRPLTYPGFGKLVQEGMVTVLPLTGEELERAILNPTEGVGVKFQEGLISTIIQDVHYQSGALPLMQYALTELFERREGRTLTHDAYRAIGGSVGALANRVEDIYAELEDDARETVRQVFLRLVTLGEGKEDTRRRVPRSELLAIGERPDLTDELIDIYAASRLLSLDNDPATRSPTVELGHEAILREWDRLREWLDESRADIRMQRDLAQAAREWREGGRDPSYLVRGTRLAQYEGWSKETGLALTQSEKEFVNAALSERARETAEEAARQKREDQLEQRRRTLSRALIGALGTGLVVALALTALAFSQRQSALRQASVGLAAQALVELEGTSPERAVLLALEALQRYPYAPQAESALAKSVPRIVPSFSIGDIGGRYTTAASWSPDGGNLAIGSLQFAWIYDVAGPDELLRSRSPEFGTECYVVDMSWSPSEERIALAIGSFSIETAQGPEEATCHEPKVGIWPPELTAPLWESAPGSGEPTSVDWSPDGSSLVTAGSDGIARIWDANTGGQTIGLVGHQDAMTEAIWSPDGEEVLTVSWDGTARVLMSSSGMEVFSTPAQATRLSGAAWSPDGNRIATSGGDGLARIWDAKTGEPQQALIGHDAEVRDVIWSPNGEMIATMSADETVRLWDGETGEQVSRFASPRARGSLAWSADGSRLAVPGGFTLIGWRLPARSPLQLSGHTDWVFEAKWSPDGSKIATVSNDGSAKIWDAMSGEELKDLSPTGGFFISWSPGGDQVVTAGFLTNAAEVWDVATGGLVYEHEFAGHQLFITPAWSPDASRIAASTFEDPSIYIWSADTGAMLISRETGECPPFSPSWSPDGEKIVTGCIFSAAEADDTPASIWDAESGTLQMTLESDAGETTRGEWSPDGQYIVAAYERGVAKVWEMATDEVVTVFAGHTGRVLDVAWAPSGDRIASSDDAGNVKIWDAWTGEEVQAMKAPSSVNSLDWSPNGTQLVAAGAFNTPLIIQVWESTEDLIAHAYECCVFRELTPEERIQFGLPLE